MRQKVENFLKEKEQITQELKKWVKHKSIPLEERWEVFVNSGLGGRKNYYWDFKSFGGDREDFHADRDKYRVYDVNDVIEYYETDENRSTEEDVNEFKEEALEKFIYSWEFDW